MAAGEKPKLATAWLEGCSGCHMSFLDMDERLIDLAGLVEIVSSPYVDYKAWPEHIDITLIEGGIGSEEDLHKALELRRRSKLLVSFGDCAVTGNVPTLRNTYTIAEIMKHAYEETAVNRIDDAERPYPTQYVPALRRQVTPVHAVVPVDVFLPGCPPPADAIFFLVTELLAGRKPTTTDFTRFGK